MSKLEELQELENISKNDDFINSESEQETEVKLQAIKKKRIPTEKQLEVLRKAREANIMKAKEKQARRRLEDEAVEKEIQRRLNEYKYELENKIVKKAVSIKKKEIKKQAILEEISDDETPMEKIKELAKKKPKAVVHDHPPASEKPKYIFV